MSGARLDAWAYTLVQLLAGGLVLLWIGRRAAGSWAELLAPWTVGYAFLRVAINGATAAAIMWLAVTQSTLLATVSVLIGAGSGWFLTRQAPPRRDWLGLALLAAGIAGFALALTGEAWRGLVWLGLSEIDGRRRLVADRLPSAQSLDRSRPRAAASPARSWWRRRSP